MTAASVVLLSKFALARNLADLSNRNLFGITDKKKLAKEWDKYNFQFLIQFCLDTCTTYTIAQINTLTGILNAYIYR